jgi:hypothetical protein
VGEFFDPERESRRRRARVARVWLCVAAMALAGATTGTFASGAGAEGSAITFPGGPLSVSVGSLSQCQSSYANHGNNFYPGTGNIGDCGFFLAFPKALNIEKGVGTTGLQAQTYGFTGFAGPSGLDLYKAVSQSEVTGAGTAASPYVQTTVFSVNDVEKPTLEYARVTETTTYVNGEPQFISTFVVKNTTLAKVPIYFRAIYAGDLYVNGNDVGTGVFLGGPPRFIGGLNTGSGIIGGFQEVGSPALPWTGLQELPYPNVWTVVQSTVESEQAFNGSIEPREVDNAAGVEWDQLRGAPGLAAGAEQAFTIINRTQIPSSLQVSPANQTLTQGQTETITVSALDITNQPYAGKRVYYTVSGANPQSGSVTLNASGQAQISYVGKNAGIDTTQLFVDLVGSGVKAAGDPSGTATVTFVPLPPKPDGSYKVQSIHANPDGTITIVFVPTQSGAATLEVTVPTGTISRNQALAAKRKACKKGLVRIKGKCRPKNTVSGKVSANGVGGVPLTLTVKPSSKVRAALKKGKTVPLTATLTYKSALGGTPTVQVFHFTVKPKKKHKKH